MANTKRTKQSVNNWYEEPIKKWFAIISGTLFISGLGYGFAVIQKDIEMKVELNKSNLECNLKLHEQSVRCQEEKQNYENKRVEILEQVVKELDKSINKHK